MRTLVANIAGLAVGVLVLSCGARTEIYSSGAQPADDAGVAAESGVPLEEGRFLYVADWLSYGVYAHRSDEQSGALTLVSGSPFATDWGALSIAVAPSHRFLYLGTAEIVVLARDGATGALKEVGSTTGSDAPVGDTIAMHPSGKWLFVAGRKKDSPEGLEVRALAINTETGALTPAGQPTLLPYMPNGLAVHPSGKFLYVSEQYGYAGGDVEGFSIDETTGALTPIGGSPFAAFQAVAMAVEPRGKYLYVCDQYGLLRTCSIDASTGVLAELPFKTLTGANPFSVVVDRSGKHIFVGNWSSDTISSYAIEPASGQPLPAPASPFDGGNAPHVFAVDVTSGFLYGSNQETATVFGFAIDSSGALKALSGSPFSAGKGAISAVAVP